ncbi:MAG: cyclic nucleotide-binding domain-containing protein [Desulforhopalus sp.]|nr:cyclic nucleotide-binding domain-containing protein [Desulforhopalus sp.]
MNSFLAKIAQLDSIRDVILLSLHGELLFGSQAQSSPLAEQEIALWRAIINDLDNPLSVDFVFDKGRYYLHATDLGFVIVGMHHGKGIKKIRTACANMQEKLADPKVRKKVLLKMLDDSDEKVKPHIVNALVPLADEEVGKILLPYLQKGGQFQPRVWEKLLLSLCKVLGQCAFYEALPPLKKVVRTYSVITNGAGGVIGTAAKRAVEQLESARVEARKAAENTLGMRLPQLGEKAMRPEADVLPPGEVGATEQQVVELLGQGQKGQAVALVLQLVVSNARAKRFQKAEQLRDWLMQIDPMALVEGIRAAEIIEQEKTAAIDAAYLVTWKELLDILSPEEFSALYHSMTRKIYTMGEMVAKQGEFLTTLFFVNSGSVQIYAISQGREVPLQTVGPGEVIGGEILLDVSAWTVNAVSKVADLSLLSLASLGRQKESFPALYSKIQDFCSRFSSPNVLFRKTNKTRRKHPDRKKISGRISIDLLDKRGKETGMAIKGDLLDLSKGGVAISLRFSKKKNALAFFGKAIRLSIGADASAAPFVCRGKVMAVRCHDFIGNDYSLHVAFAKELSNTEILLVSGKQR